MMLFFWLQGGQLHFTMCHYNFAMNVVLDTASTLHLYPYLAIDFLMNALIFLVVIVTTYVLATKHEILVVVPAVSMLLVSLSLLYARFPSVSPLMVITTDILDKPWIGGIHSCILLLVIFLGLGRIKRAARLR